MAQLSPSPTIARPPVSPSPVVAPPPVEIVGTGNVGKSNTLTTPQGPITWTRSANGTVNAEGGGQTFTASGEEDSDGSWQKHAAYARTGQAPYLTTESIGVAAERKVSFSLSAGSSQLTLTIADINLRATSGTAILSGTWNGAAVNWTGHADLTSNPFVNQPISGWPTGAFETELQQAAFFAPLAAALAQSVVQPPPPLPVGAPPPATPGRAGTLQRDVWDVLGNAGAWCAGGALAGAKGGWVGAGLGCAGGATGSLLSDLWSYVRDAPTEDQIPPIDLPPDPEPIGPVTQSAPDDPPPADDGDGSGSQSSPGPIDTNGGAGGAGGDDGGSDYPGSDNGSTEKED